MLPSAPLMVQPSWVQTASIAENVLVLVLAIRNTPATDSASTAPPTLSNADPAVLTRTVEPANWPGTLPNVEGAPLGDVGDPSPPQAETSVASVAQEATWHASAQNWRRETSVFVSDITEVLARASAAGRQEAARSRPRAKDAIFVNQQPLGTSLPITNSVGGW